MGILSMELADKFETDSLSLNLWRDFDLNDNLRPYAGFGLGLGRAVLGDMGDDIFLHLGGFGVNWLFGQRLSLRAPVIPAPGALPVCLISGSGLYPSLIKWFNPSCQSAVSQKPLGRVGSERCSHKQSYNCTSDQLPILSAGASGGVSSLIVAAIIITNEYTDEDKKQHFARSGLPATGQLQYPENCQRTRPLRISDRFYGRFGHH